MTLKLTTIRNFTAFNNEQASTEKSAIKGSEITNAKQFK